jgi:hypothetical protein
MKCFHGASSVLVLGEEQNKVLNHIRRQQIDVSMPAMLQKKGTRTNAFTIQCLGRSFKARLPLAEGKETCHPAQQVSM